MIFSHKNNKAHHGHELHEGLSNVGHDPFLDWMFIIIIGTLVTCGLVAAGFLSYTRVGSILSQPAAKATSTQSSAIDPAMLDHILGQFEARATERAELIKGYKGPLDPSL